jgi:hypothetical protein
MPARLKRGNWPNPVSSAIIFKRSFPVAATLAKLSANPSAAPVNLHDMELAAARADALDHGLAGPSGFRHCIMLLVCILEQLTILIFSNNIILLSLHFGPRSSGDQIKSRDSSIKSNDTATRGNPRMQAI